MNRKGFVVSAVLYPLLVLFLALVMGLISMSSTRKNILDNMKMEISDSTFDETECSCETILNKLNYIIEKGIGGGVRNIINLNIKSYSSPTVNTLPKEYSIKNDIAINSNVEVNGYYIQDYQPVNPVNGSVWVKIRQGSNSTISNDKVVIPIATLEQYKNGSWTAVDAYIYNGTNWTAIRSSRVTTATSEDIAVGKTAIVEGQKVTGTNTQTSKFPDKMFATDSFLWSEENSIRAGREIDDYDVGRGVNVEWHNGSDWKSLASSSGTITCQEDSNCSSVPNLVYGQYCINSTNCFISIPCLGCSSYTSSLKGNALIDNNVYCYGSGCTDTRQDIASTWELKVSDRNSFYKAGRIVITLLNHNNTETTVNQSGVDAFYTRVPAGYSKVDSNGDYSASYYSLVPVVTILKDTDSWEIKDVVSNADYYTKQEKYNSLGSKDTNSNSRIVDLAQMSDQTIIYKNGFSADFKSDTLILKYSAVKATYNDKYKTVRAYRQDDAGISLEEKWLNSSSSEAYSGLDYNAAGTWYYYYKTVGTSGITFANPIYRLQARYPYWDVAVQYYK